MDFYRRVAVVGQRIPRGRVATYGQIAMLCQKPRAARLVGYALGRVLPPGTLPAQRVVGHGGRLSGARSFATPYTQRELLEREGVCFLPDGRVDMARSAWQTTLQQVQELEALFLQLGI